MTTSDSTALEKMERLQTILSSEKKEKEKCGEAQNLYAELEDLIIEIDPITPYKVEFIRGSPILCKTDIYAGYFTGMLDYRGKGEMQLRKVIAKLKNRESSLEKKTPAQHSPMEMGIRIMKNFRACCQFSKHPTSEKEVQDILWIMLRGAFSLIREETLPKFAAKSYIPDFAIPEVRALVEVKFIGEKTQPKHIQEEILADIQPYLKNTGDYESVIVFIYDHANKKKDESKFVSDLEAVEGIHFVIIMHSIAST